MTKSTTIRCERLSKTYGRIVALQDLNLTVEAGTIFGFLGPNGAGKTTTIRLLVGLARPTAGRGWVAGHEVTADVAARRLVGYLPEEPAFYSWMTGADFLDYVGQLFGLASAERKKRVEELLALAGLQEAGRRRIGGYSRGMRQRLGVAQTLINRPPVLILDEPASALDPQGRRDVLTLIEQLREHATVFMSTHILSDVERVCDRLAIIDQGRLVIEADRQSLQNDYAPPVFELAWDEGDNDPAQVTGAMHLLASVPWVSQIERQARTLRLHVNNRTQAQRELLPLVAQSRLVLSRYELVRPTLEDIFLRLVKQEAPQ